ncbi:DUF3081 family protein [Chromatiaceae bacterium AAb-1]|nr:DUF3081 family protein [Chromatiaceae bacterium AAb-1]
MQNELDGKFLLSVYSIIEKNGEPVETEFGQGYQLENIRVSPGHDGYEVYFDNGRLQLVLGFHNKWHSTAKNEADLDEFIAVLKRIHQQYR